MGGRSDGPDAAARPDGDVDDALLDPERNMALGQKYLAHLLEDGSVRGKLSAMQAGLLSS